MKKFLHDRARKILLTAKRWLWFSGGPEQRAYEGIDKQDSPDRDANRAIEATNIKERIEGKVDEIKSEITNIRGKVETLGTKVSEKFEDYLRANTADILSRWKISGTSILNLRTSYDSTSPVTQAETNRSVERLRLAKNNEALRVLDKALDHVYARVQFRKEMAQTLEGTGLSNELKNQIGSRMESELDRREGAINPNEDISETDFVDRIEATANMIRYAKMVDKLQGKNTIQTASTLPDIGVAMPQPSGDSRYFKYWTEKTGNDLPIVYVIDSIEGHVQQFNPNDSVSGPTAWKYVSEQTGPNAGNFQDRFTAEVRAQNKPPREMQPGMDRAKMEQNYREALATTNANSLTVNEFNQGAASQMRARLIARFRALKERQASIYRGDVAERGGAHLEAGAGGSFSSHYRQTVQYAFNRSTDVNSSLSASIRNVDFALTTAPSGPKGISRGPRSGPSKGLEKTPKLPGATETLKWGSINVAAGERYDLMSLPTPDRGNRIDGRSLKVTVNGRTILNPFVVENGRLIIDASTRGPLKADRAVNFNSGDIVITYNEKNADGQVIGERTQTIKIEGNELQSDQINMRTSRELSKDANGIYHVHSGAISGRDVTFGEFDSIGTGINVSAASVSVEGETGDFKEYFDFEPEGDPRGIKFDHDGGSGLDGLPTGKVITMRLNISRNGGTPVMREFKFKIDHPPAPNSDAATLKSGFRNEYNQGELTADAANPRVLGQLNDAGGMNRSVRVYDATDTNKSVTATIDTNGNIVVSENMPVGQYVIETSAWQGNSPNKVTERQRISVNNQLGNNSLRVDDVMPSTDIYSGLVGPEVRRQGERVQLLTNTLNGGANLFNLPGPRDGIASYKALATYNKQKVEVFVDMSSGKPVVRLQPGQTIEPPAVGQPTRILTLTLEGSRADRQSIGEQTIHMEVLPRTPEITTAAEAAELSTGGTTLTTTTGDIDTVDGLVALPVAQLKLTDIELDNARRRISAVSGIGLDSDAMDINNWRIDPDNGTIELKKGAITASNDGNPVQITLEIDRNGRKETMTLTVNVKSEPMVSVDNLRLKTGNNFTETLQRGDIEGPAILTEFKNLPEEIKPVGAVMITRPGSIFPEVVNFEQPDFKTVGNQLQIGPGVNLPAGTKLEFALGLSGQNEVSQRITINVGERLVPASELTSTRPPEGARTVPETIRTGLGTLNQKKSLVGTEGARLIATGENEYMLASSGETISFKQEGGNYILTTAGESASFTNLDHALAYGALINHYLKAGRAANYFQEGKPRFYTKSDDLGFQIPLVGTRVMGTNPGVIKASTGKVDTDIVNAHELPLLDQTLTDQIAKMLRARTEEALTGTPEQQTPIVVDSAKTTAVRGRDLQFSVPNFRDTATSGEHQRQYDYSYSLDGGKTWVRFNQKDVKITSRDLQAAGVNLDGTKQKLLIACNVVKQDPRFSRPQLSNIIEHEMPVHNPFEFDFEGLGTSPTNKIKLKDFTNENRASTERELTLPSGYTIVRHGEEGSYKAHVQHNGQRIGDLEVNSATGALSLSSTTHSMTVDGDSLNIVRN